jgi:hypothetical protein
MSRERFKVALQEQRRARAVTMDDDPPKFRVGQTLRIEIGRSGDDVRCTIIDIQKVFGKVGDKYRYQVRDEKGNTYWGHAGYGDTLISDESRNVYR